MHDGGELLGEMDYEAFLATGDARRQPSPASTDEWQAISLNYTSGTTGNPKGVVYHHRGAYLNALGQLLAFGVTASLHLPVDTADVPLQRLDLHLGRDRRRRPPTCACAGSIQPSSFR